MKVAIVGAGVVGRTTGEGLESRGHETWYVDIDAGVLENLRRKGHNVDPTLREAVRRCGIVMISVPTPTVNGAISLEGVLEASRRVGTVLRGLSGYKLIVVRSTVVPRSTRDRVIPVLENWSLKRAGADFGVCFNPEFLRESTALQDFLSPDRIVIGEYDARSGLLLEGLYRSFGKPIIRCSLEEAELAKYVANCFLAIKISYFNEVGRICASLGADPSAVSHAVAADRRIGAYGTASGKPYGGKCLPKDVAALLAHLDKMGERFEVLEAAHKVNEKMLSMPIPARLSERSRPTRPFADLQSS